MKTRMLILLAWRYLAHRRFASFVSVAAIALSLAVVVATGNLNFAVKKTAVEGSIRYPLIIGPSQASGVQLIMSTLFFIDKPTGTIPFAVYEELANDKRVSAAYPIAVADNYRTIRIVGVDEAYLNDLEFGVAQGAIDLSDPTHAVVGAAAARRAELSLGDTFQGQHGMVGSADAHTHEELTYKVVGILNIGGGPEDAAIFTSYQSVWKIHAGHHHGHAHAEHDQHAGEAAHDEHAAEVQHDAHAEHAVHGEHEAHAENGNHAGHEEPAAHAEHAKHDAYHLGTNALTAVLVRTRNPVYTGMLEREYSLNPGTVAVDTARSIRGFVQHLNTGERVIELLSGGMLFVALIMILVTLVMSLNERRKELALLRSLGVGRMTLSLAVMLEALVLSLLGAMAGLGLGHVLALLIREPIRQATGVEIEPWVVTNMESLGFWATLIAGQVLALVAMLWTYRMDVVEEIARG